MEKECEICGAFFTTNNKNRKYCDDCSRHSRSRRYEYENALRVSRRRLYEPVLHHGNCGQCGRKAVVPDYLLHKVSASIEETGESAIFCSIKCRKAWLRDREE